MRCYPINLNLHGKKVVIIGGGRVAARKAGRLVAAGASVTVIAPELCNQLQAIVSAGNATHLARGYSEGDLAGAFLAFAATDDEATNASVATEARRIGVLVDRVDAPADSDFGTPALLCRGDLQITVSTGGVSPALSRKIVETLETQFGPEYAEALELLGRVREKILTAKAGSEYNEPIFSELAALDLPAMIKNGSRDEALQTLLKLLGPEFAQVLSAAVKKDPS
ncbi:bifunctional precorrin-2 dehydrogenase/sirohydrochlorin ferrochelatase [Geomonas sp. RF6]|uniref:precorrin-2 dehydrogenase/sirohydrochlorin ferrochelatase family protein n=1 Tax=Geomonas sp. RF6 TaxID=2897342 RepID=UPI001E3EC7E4|nr:bifunctional precorrin-2 dehydrogenase/sirohydrochlorin ferrochelatase [Geomonas sp. RF6]UFS71681.1 bifunctional precorrin-2 dehydrogenase/sirohydrochlorin ferrochelatase [Geomonas sp. RF6]